ncbi:MAG: trypsin-like peptidase domain-containing protein [Patescibacteria group bacterium]
MDSKFKKFFIIILASSIIVSSVLGGAMGFWAGLVASGNGFKDFFTREQAKIGTKEIVTKIDEESSVISSVEKVSPAVVSIIVSKDLSAINSNNGFSDDFLRQFFGGNYEEFFGSGQNQAQGENSDSGKQEIGGGTGFIVSSDGYIVTNKHVVYDETADYTVLMNDETKHEAKVLARDSVTDLAVLKIEGDKFPTVDLGDSDSLKVGQSVIAIGNALGEFRNTVSTGIVSGLARSVTAGGSGFGSEQLVGVIQTDASINSGNSGGPLLNIAGQVIGINTAMAQNAQNIGFAIPINEVKGTIESVRKNGRIIRPWLGVRYIQIDEVIAKNNKLEVDYGALIARGKDQTELAVIPGSPADKAGLVENDIIIEINGQKIEGENTLLKLVSKFKVGDEITLKVLHKGDKKDVKVRLEEMKN